jgi:hypothetical protein
MSLSVVSLFIDGVALMVAAVTWRRVERQRRQAAIPPRSVRMIVEIDGRIFIDMDSKLALAMLDCDYGQPVVNDYAYHGVQLRLTFREGGTP